MIVGEAPSGASFFVSIGGNQMAKPLSRRAQQRRDRILESLSNTAVLLSKIKAEDVEELIRRDAIEVDGSSGGGIDIGMPRSASSNSSSPVERAVIAKMEGKGLKDPVRAEVKSVERNIIDGEHSFIRALQSIVMLRDGVEKQRQRSQASAPCEVCEILPAAKQALCLDDWADWVANGAPDRQRWVAYKTKARSSDGKILVTEQPPARHPARTLDNQK